MRPVFLLLAFFATELSGQGLVERIEDGLGRGAFDEVEPLVEELVGQWREAGDDVELGRALHTLGLVKDAVLKPGEAIAALEEASGLVSEASELGDVFDALGKSRQHAFDYAGAEDAFERALELREGEWADVTLDHLGLLYLEAGRVSEAGAVFNGTLERTAGEDVEMLVQRHGYLGRFHVRVRNFGRARAHYEEALVLAGEGGGAALRAGLGVALMREGKLEQAREVLESVVNVDGENRAVVLNNLGTVLIELGEPGEAAKRFEEGRVLVEALLGESHAGMAVWYNNLGVAAERSGDLLTAKNAFESALQVTEGQVADSHELRARVWNNLAVNAVRRESRVEAREAAWAASAAAESALVDVVAGGDEGQRLNYKARVDLHSVLCSLGGEEGPVLDLILATSDVVGDSGERATWRDVQQRLGTGSAWVRYVRFWDFEADVAGYGAFVVRGSGEPVWVRLGDEAKLKRWLKVISDRIDAMAGEGRVPVLTMEAALRAIDEAFWRPLAGLLGAGTETVWVTADGAMHFVSMAVLLGEEGRFLCERVAQLIVTENASAITDRRDPARRDEWRLLGVSEYGGRRLDETIYPEQLVALCRSLKPLDGIEEELAMVEEAARSAGAKVSRVSGAGRGDLARADVLHLAAHGFYLGGGREVERAGLIDFDFDPEVAMASGVVMRAGDDDDGVVFSPELSGLDLSGGWIATVSSCRSGLGTAVSGEGVVGLRRALSQTGVENVVLALWPVADEAGADVMGAFYRAAVETGNAPGAMWSVQREFLAGARQSGRFDETVMEVGAFVVSHRGAAGAPVEAVTIPRRRAAVWWGVLALGSAGFVVSLARFFAIGRADAEE